MSLKILAQRHDKLWIEERAGLRTFDEARAFAEAMLASGLAEQVTIIEWVATATAYNYNGHGYAWRRES